MSRHYCRSHQGYFVGPVAWITSRNARGIVTTRRKICPACAQERRAAKEIAARNTHPAV